MSIKETTLQLVLKFLKDKGYTQSFLNLEVQSKINLKDYPKQIQFFKKIIMRGDFKEAVQFICTFEQKIPNTTLKKLTLQIYKQKLYQLLQNPSQIQLRSLFQKEIINVCSEDQYQNLFTLLTCRSVKQIPEMDDWSPMKGRFNCFEKIQPHLSNFFNLTQYQKTSIKSPSFSLQEAIQSFIAAQQKVEQRMEKSQNSSKQIGSIKGSNERQSKQSIQIKPQKNQSELKIKKQLDQMEKIPEPNESKPLFVNPNTNLSNTSISNRLQGSYAANNRKRPSNQIQISQSRVQKSQYHQKIDKLYPVINQQNQQTSNIMQASTFNKKYNPFLGNTGVSAANKIKQDKYSNNSKNLKVEELEDQAPPLSYKEIRERQKKYPPTSTSYLKQFQRQNNDSDYKQEIKRNLAYLDQNNSMVQKEDQNDNFTFSNGAQQSAHDRIKKINKISSFSDPKAIRTCQFSPSGNLFALGTNSSYLKIYDVEQLFQLNHYKQILPACQIPQLHAKSIYCLDWSSNQKSIATCSNDLTIKITDFPDNYNFTNYKTNVIGRHESSVRMIKFNALENRIVSCGDDSLIKIWDIGKIKKCTNLKGHTQSISAFKFAYNEQENIIYSVSKDCTIRKWDLRQSDCVTVSQPHDCELTYIANNIDRIVASDKNGNVLFYNEDLELQHSIKIHQQQIRSIDGTDYDDLLLTASFDGHISLFTQKSLQTPIYHQHNEKLDDKVVFATFLNNPAHKGFASTSTLGICNIYSYQ